MDIHVGFTFVMVIFSLQVSEEVERALAKMGPARLNGRFIHIPASVWCITCVD